MAYSPGSFSKNFAWHGAGLRKLHSTLRDGFERKLTVVDRQVFRENAGIEADIALIPLNFFLHNRNGRISIDELVQLAIDAEHSSNFDRLALFTLNLSRVGSGKDKRSGRPIVSRPAMWANEFVRERLWRDGSWRLEALSKESIDEFLQERMRAEPAVRVKCRSNYRHLFELCNYRVTGEGAINSGAEDWMASALFLAWDRHILDGGQEDQKSLLQVVEKDEVYKLLGVPAVQAASSAERLAEIYREVGQLRRFRQGTKYSTERSSSWSAMARDEGGVVWMEQGGSDAVVERRVVERNEQKRDRVKAAALKRKYGNACQFCGVRLEVGERRYYAEAAHIKAIGEPHNGPDTVENMLVLCPNHHLQFDRGVLRLQTVAGQVVLRSKAAGDPLNGKVLRLRHEIAEDLVRYHYEWFE